jgi:hypothetical protein
LITNRRIEAGNIGMEQINVEKQVPKPEDSSEFFCIWKQIKQSNEIAKRAMISQLKDVGLSENAIRRIVPP